MNDLIAELSRSHGMQVLFLHVPFNDETDDPLVHEPFFWPAMFGDGTRIAGIPGKTLFQAFSRKESQNFYLGIHLNRNGKRYFTTALLPFFLFCSMKASPLVSFSWDIGYSNAMKQAHR